MVIGLAKILGYRVYHTYFSVKSQPGWPDLVLYKPGRFLMAELKTARGNLTAAQQQVIADLREAGIEVHVWRPQDWETIQNVLSSRKSD